MRLSMDKNEENEKLQLRDHPQNTTTLGEFLWTKMKKMRDFNEEIIHKIRPLHGSFYGQR